MLSPLSSPSSSLSNSTPPSLNLLLLSPLSLHFPHSCSIYLPSFSFLSSSSLLRITLRSWSVWIEGCLSAGIVDTFRTAEKLVQWGGGLRGSGTNCHSEQTQSPGPRGFRARLGLWTTTRCEASPRGGIRVPADDWLISVHLSAWSNAKRVTRWPDRVFKKSQYWIQYIFHIYFFEKTAASGLIWLIFSLKSWVTNGKCLKR